jgi:hypothetical protein
MKVFRLFACAGFLLAFVGCAETPPANPAAADSLSKGNKVQTSSSGKQQPSKPSEGPTGAKVE